MAKIAGLIVAYRSAQVLFTAVALGIFEALHEAPKGAATVAKSCSLDGRSCEVLLDALAGLGFLEKSSGLYRIPQEFCKHLLKDSPQSLFHNLRYQNLLCPAWAALADVVRSGEPREDLLTHLRDPQFTEDYILAMREIAGRPAAEVAALLRAHAPRSLLDVGCGPGEFSRALAEACPGLRAVLLDLPGTLRVTRRLQSASTFPGGLEYREGDYRTADFGNDAFDMVLLSHVTHDEGSEDTLGMLRKSYKALHHAGRVAIHDFVLDSDRTRPLFPALFSVHMLTYTSRGRTYTEEEYSEGLRLAGFRDISTHQVCAGAENASRLIIGVRP